MKKFFITVFIITIVTVNSFSQPGKTIDLKFNIPTGSGYDYSADVNMTMSGDAAGQPINFTNAMNFGYKFKVVSDSANWKKVSTTVARIAMKMNSGMVNIDYDSDKPTDTSNTVNSTVSKVFDAMKGSEFTFMINEKGEIGSISGIDDMKKKMLANAPENDPAAAGVSGSFNEESFRESMQQSFGFYPGKPVKIGDTWTNVLNTNNNGVAMKLDNIYTLESVTGDIASIKVDSKISSESGVPITGTMTGTMQYDIPTGIPVTGNLDMKMNISTNAGGQTTSMDMDIKTTMTGKKF